MNCPENHPEMRMMTNIWRTKNHKTGKWSKNRYTAYYCPCCSYSVEVDLGPYELTPQEEGKFELED